jgi:putative methionine-R-sulfoxide reductase with GAF domain
VRWEVSIPAAKGRATASKVTVDAENWLSALKIGLTQTGDKTPVGSSFHCAILEDESVKVSDFGRSCVYLLKPLEGDGGGAAAAKPPVESFAPPKPKSMSIPADRVPRPSAAHGPTAPAPIPVPPLAAPPVHAPFVPPPVLPAPPLPAPVAPTPAALAATAPAHVPVAGIPGVSAPSAAAAARVATTPAAGAPPEPAPVLPAYQIFARRDENPDAGNPLTYRDRIFAVPPGTKPEAAVLLLKHFFAEIQLEIAGHGPGKFINLAVFDHVFKGRPERPAIATLSWKDWRGADPEITFPAAVPAPDKSPTPAKGIPHVERGVTPVERRRRSSHEIPAADTTNDDRLAEVFEAMQDLFLLTTQREAATFALDLALAKIPCEAGSTVLNDLDRGDLFFAAVRGPASERLDGVRLEQGKGIIGAAARSLEPITIADVANDPRFFPDFDRMTGFQTRTVLCAPLHYEGRAVGAIELLNKKGGGAFTQSDINVLSYVAENLGNFVATALPESDEPPENPQQSSKSRAAAKRR